MGLHFMLSKALGEKRMTQSELARKTGIRPNTINELYHEFANGIKWEHPEKICKVLDCKPSKLIKLDREKE